MNLLGTPHVYKLVIFDWDGTLMDSASKIVSCMQLAANSLALPVPSEAQIRNIIGLSLEKANQMLIPGISDEDNVRLRNAYSQYFSEIDKTPTPLYDGVYESLLRMRNKGFRLAVATGKSRRGLDRVLSETSLAKVFEISRGADETKSKPDPLMLEQILQVTGVSAQESIMVGDTSYDLEMAQKIAMPSVAVSYGMHSVESLQTYNPVLVVDKLAEIEVWLNKVNGECK